MNVFKILESYWSAVGMNKWSFYHELSLFI